MTPAFRMVEFRSFSGIGPGLQFSLSQDHAFALVTCLLRLQKPSFYVVMLHLKFFSVQLYVECVGFLPGCSFGAPGKFHVDHMI